MAQDFRLKKRKREADVTHINIRPGGKKRRRSVSLIDEVEPEPVLNDKEQDDSKGLDSPGESDADVGVQDLGEEESPEEEEDWGGFGSASGEVEEEQEGEKEQTGASQGDRTGNANANVNKPPTRDELRSIREAAELYRSNTFKLAIDALLPNVRPKESRVKPLEEFLRILYTSLMSLPSPSPSPSTSTPTHPLEAARALASKGVAVPYPPPQPSEETAWKVSFEKPSDLIVVGSWATKTGVKAPGKAGWVVDVAVEMPAGLFQEKDYLDNRLFHKRAYYLACLAEAIRSDEKLRVDVYYDSPLDSRLTSLILVPRKDGSSTDFTKLNAHVRLLPVLPSPSPISLHHLSPTRCNLRIKTGSSQLNASTTNTLSDPTPIYNSDLLLCASARERLLRAHELVQEVPALRDALALLRVWANQRAYSPGPKDKGVAAGFEGRGYFWTTVMHAVVSGEESFGQKKLGRVTMRKPVGRGLSSYQLFRAALDFLASHDFASEPFFVKGGSKFLPDAYPSDGDGAVFVDSSSVNILAGAPVTSLDLLRWDAKITLDILNNSSVGEAVDPFDVVFLRDRRHLSTRFDVVLCIDLRKASLRKSNLVEKLDHGSLAQLILHAMSSLLRRALGDRVHAIAILLPPPDLRPISQDGTLPSLTKVHIGLILNTDNSFRLVDHGPAASEQDTQEAIAFRELWGDKAELRRFKDGKIVESVVWEVKTADARARIPADIVCHILSRHLGLDPDKGDVRTFQREFDELLRVRVPDGLGQKVVLPAAQPGFKNAMTAFDELVRQLKSLDDAIPLAVLNVSPVSSDLRYTSVFTPMPTPPSPKGSTSTSLSLPPPTMRYLPAMEITIQFERSGRWPDDLIAIQKMKLAFYEQMANALMSEVPGLRASIVTSTQATTMGNLDNAYLEIVTPNGWAFAARIWHDREETLLKRILDSKRKPRIVDGNANGAVPSASLMDSKSHEHHLDRQAASNAYEIYMRRYLHAPKHHRAIANLCHRFPAFSGTVRLVKRWFSAHCVLEGHVSGEAVELICAYVFVGSSSPRSSSSSTAGGGMDVPGTKELGFFRVLAFLKEWTWESGLFVSLYESDDNENSKPNEDEGNEGNVHVKAGAGSGTGVWTISTSEDRSGRVWTAEGPDAVVARRIKALASASLEYALANERDGFVPKTLFLHPTDDYDLLIRLKPEMLCRSHQSLDASQSQTTAGGGTVSKYANISLIMSDDDEPLRVDFDPALMFFNDLKRIYHGALAFFFDAYGGDVIGAVWDPTLFTARPFRVLADYSSMPMPSDGDRDEKRSQKQKQKEKGSMVVLNQAGVLAEIQRLGEGIVKSIEVQRVH